MSEAQLVCHHTKYPYIKAQLINFAETKPKCGGRLKKSLISVDQGR